MLPLEAVLIIFGIRLILRGVVGGDTRRRFLSGCTTFFTLNAVKRFTVSIGLLSETGGAVKLVTFSPNRELKSKPKSVVVGWIFPVSISRALGPTEGPNPLSEIGNLTSTLSFPGSPGRGCELIACPERLAKLLVMLATLSFRIMELAEERTICSLRARPVIPGYGRICFVHTSESKRSSLTLSALEGARTGMRFVPSRDCDLLTAAFVDEVTVSLVALVFLIMT